MAKSLLDEENPPPKSELPPQRVSHIKSPGAVKKPLQGWNLVGVLFSLSFGLLLAIIETSITATALVTIGKYFNDSVKATWVVLAYLLSYMGFAIIFTRLSDGIGRKVAVIIAYVMFAAFSLGGGLGRTLNEVIAMRVLQGIGGSGLYSMIMVIGPEITPVKYLGAFSGVIGAVLAIGSVLGPILGGAITERSTWRWIYLFNAPCAALGVAVLLISWPRGRSNREKSSEISFESLKRVDWFGAVLLLGASTLLVFALQEAGSTTYAWNNAEIITTLTVSGVCWVAFFGWILWLSFGEAAHHMRAIFPLSIALSRPTGPAIIQIMLSGFPYFVAIINLPQRFQIVNDDTPLMAGIHLMPLLCSMAFGSFLGGAVSSKRNLSSQTLVTASCLILLGCGLLSTLDNGQAFYRPTYGYQFILGLGIGLTFSASTVLTVLANTADDVAAAQGALSQARILGGSIGLAMATIVLNNKLKEALAGVLDPNQVKALEQSLSTIATLPGSDRAIVAQVYAESFNAQMRICTYLSAGGVLAALCTWQREPASVAARKEKQDAWEREGEEGVEGG